MYIRFNIWLLDKKNEPIISASGNSISSILIAFSQKLSPIILAFFISILFRCLASFKNRFPTTVILGLIYSTIQLVSSNKMLIFSPISGVIIIRLFLPSF